MAGLLLGKDAALYIATAEVADGGLGIAVGDFIPLNWKTGTVGTPPSTEYKFDTNIIWKEMVKIGDSSQAPNFEEVDTTTRETARTGFSSKIKTLKEGLVSWTAQLRKLEDDDDGNLLRTLMYAADNTELLGLLDLSAQVTATGIGAVGTVANWLISYSVSRDVKGLQQIEFTADLQDFSDNVEVYDNVGTPTLRKFQKTA